MQKEHFICKRENRPSKLALKPKQNLYSNFYQWVTFMIPAQCVHYIYVANGSVNPVQSNVKSQKWPKFKPTVLAMPIYLITFKTIH